MKKSILAEVALYAVLGAAVVAFTPEKSLSCPSCLSPPLAGAKVKAKPARAVERISPQQAQKMMKTGAKMVDVREPAEWEEAHVKGSTLIPLAKVKQQPRKAALAPKVLLLCRSGKRSAVAAAAMSELKNVKLFVVEGGIVAWQKAGLPVQKGK